jgi:putative membrane protein
MPHETLGKTLAVHPSARIIELALVFFVVVLGLKLWLFHGEPWFDYAWRGFLGVGLLWIGYLYLSRITSIYSISPIEVSIEVGIFSKKRRAAPLNRVTNFEVNRPFLKRILGLADLHVDTAGGSEIEIELTEMTLSDALDYQQFLSWHLGAQKAADAGDSPHLRATREAALEKVVETTERLRSED